MFQLKRVTLLAMLMLSSSTLFFCSKQKDPVTEMTTKITQNSGENLVETLAKDQLFIDYTAENVKFTSQFCNWVSGLSKAEIQAHSDSLEAAVQNGGNIVDLSRSEQAVKSFEDSQLARWREIEAKYPQLSDMNNDDFADVIMRADFAVVESFPPSNTTSGACEASYRTCRIWCYNRSGNGYAYVNCLRGCWASYEACVYYNAMHHNPNHNNQLLNKAI